MDRVSVIERWAVGGGVEFLNIGPARDPRVLDKLPQLLRDTRTVSCSFALPQRLSPQLAVRVAQCILRLADMTGTGAENGLGETECAECLGRFPRRVEMRMRP